MIIFPASRCPPLCPRSYMSLTHGTAHSTGQGSEEGTGIVHRAGKRYRGADVSGGLNGGSIVDSGTEGKAPRTPVCTGSGTRVTEPVGSVVTADCRHRRCGSGRRSRRRPLPRLRWREDRRQERRGVRPWRWAALARRQVRGEGGRRAQGGRSVSSATWRRWRCHRPTRWNSPGR